MKFNWNQTGMPASLVGRLTQRNEFAEFKSVLNDAQNQVLQPVDAEAMARELVASGGRPYVEMVRELSTALATARKDLEAANRRYERLAADLARRGIPLEEPPPRNADGPDGEATARTSDRRASPPDGGLAEWEEWNRKFESLLG